MSWISGDRAQRLRYRPEQDIVDHGLVLEGDCGERIRYGEHHVEVRRVEQFRLAVLEPLRAREPLAFGAVPVATGVVGDALVAAAVAALDVAAERRGAAAFDRADGTALCGGQRCAVPLTIGFPVAAEDVRHLRPLPGHK